MSRDLPHILHLYSGVTEEGEVRRVGELINAFGPKLRHSVAFAEDGAMLGYKDFGKGIDVDLSPDFPSLEGHPTPGRMTRIAKAMQPFDLVLSYNYGAIDAAMAHTLFKDAFGLPPLIHFEDDLGEESPARPKRARTWYRRIALGKTAGLVVPTERLEELALVEWQQPMGRVKHIPYGIDTKLFAMRPKPEALRLIKRPGEYWIGTQTNFADAADIAAIVRAFAELKDDSWHLVILGEGPGREAIEREVDRLRINDHVHLPGPGRDPDRAFGLFDIFASAADDLPFPFAMAKAMAAGLPVAAPGTKTIRGILSDENAQLLGEPGNASRYAVVMEDLTRSKDLRQSLGQANRAKAMQHYDRDKIIATFRRLMTSAMKREF
ncbi:glycosyltransferase [Erythrobacter litoralis]|uniref:glycosyltransferase family 4 protein n=1 Tax=Erythrobacter litoralis TaxID=39960 RepID=UPI002435E63E|nr:glycosyltransferase [Erythrobacter litoralis]MDG6080304.1 glycosyltransferase [Erythrobacter litoralis]